MGADIALVFLFILIGGVFAAAEMAIVTLREGQGLVEIFRVHGLIIEVGAWLLVVGEKSGNLSATMDRIAQSVERDSLYRGIITAQRTEPQPTSADAISSAARSISETLKLAAIVCYTGSGSTGLRMSRERPDTPIIALTPIATTARRLALAWGLHCVLTEDAHDLDDMVTRATGIAQREGFADAGQRIIITAGLPLGTPGATNMLRIAYVN